MGMIGQAAYPSLTYGSILLQHHLAYVSKPKAPPDTEVYHLVINTSIRVNRTARRLDGEYREGKQFEGDVKGVVP
jgi:hypothetical protein